MVKLRRSLLLGLILFALLAVVRSWAGHADLPDSANQPVALELKVPPNFRFVALGDTRFHDPSDTEPANPAVRQALVAAIDKEHPAFISIGGDIVYSGESAKDWQVWDSETAVWREHKITVYPAIGNHDLKGDPQTALKKQLARSRKSSRVATTPFAWAMPLCSSSIAICMNSPARKAIGCVHKSSSFLPPSISCSFSTTRRTPVLPTKTRFWAEAIPRAQQNRLWPSISKIASSTPARALLCSTGMSTI